MVEFEFPKLNQSNYWKKYPLTKIKQMISELEEHQAYMSDLPRLVLEDEYWLHRMQEFVAKKEEENFTKNLQTYKEKNSSQT